MSSHPAIALLATHTGDPMGVAARKVLDDLEAAHEEIRRLRRAVVKPAPAVSPVVDVDPTVPRVTS